MENRILLKTRELLVRNGVKYVTMDDLAAQLGISKKTIYQYYTDKDALINAVVDFELEEQALKCQGSQEKAENAVHEMFLLLEHIQVLFKNMNPLILTELAKHHPTAFEKIKQHKNEFMHQIINSNLKRGISQGVYRDNIDADIIAAYRLETGFIAFNQEVFPFSRYDVAKVNVQIMEHFIYGLLSTKGLELMDKYKQAKENSDQEEDTIHEFKSK